MKKAAILFLSLMMAYQLSNAQNISAKTKTSNNNTSKKTGTKKQQKKSDRIIIDFTHDLWQETPEGMDLGMLSPGFNVYSMFDFPIAKTNFSIAIGGGISTHNIYSENYPVLATDPDNVNETIIEFKKIQDIADANLLNDYSDNKINKFNITYLDIPIEVRFRTRGNPQFKIAAGFKTGMMLSNHTKYKGDDFKLINPTKEEIKFKEHDISYVNSLLYGPTIRIGMGIFSVTGFYALNPIFEEGKGPEMYPISVGVSLTPF